MKCVGIIARQAAAAFVFLSLVACSNVNFGPTADAPLILRSGMPLSDEFTQGYINKKLDILFVVDNSISMAEEQERLGERIGSFIATLHDVDWQIGITTTDVSNGRYGLKGSLLPLSGASGYILTPRTPNYEQVFRNTVVRRETIECTTDCPSGDEQPLAAAIMAMQKHNTVNAGFFRPGADIGLLVLSDEDEQSEGAGTTPEDVINTVRSLWSDTKRLYTYGIIIRPGDTACLNSQVTGGYYGTFVARLANLTGGLVGSICEEDYAPTLGILGESARKLLEYVELRGNPDPDSIRVTFTPSHNTTYRLEGRRIFFTTPPAKGTKIRVDYIVE